MNSFYMYIVQCCDGSYYVGHTDDIENRLNEHNSGIYIGYTLQKLPIILVYLEAFSLRDEAFFAEMKIKKWSRAKKEALICGDFDGLHKKAKKIFK